MPLTARRITYLRQSLTKHRWLMSAKVAVVIVNWNGRAVLEAYLPSVVKHSQTDWCKVFVIDNASTDNSVEYVSTHFPTVGLVRLDKNHGFAGGYNLGLRCIEADYLVLLNSDVRVTPGWVNAIIDYMDSHGDVAACQPKILSERDNSSFEYAGACGGYIDRYGYPFCRGRMFSVVEKDKGQYDDVASIFWASGAALFIRSSVFDEMGGFDTTFFAHMEEIDLCWRIKRAGYKICCVPSSVVYHVGGATLGAENPYKTYLNFRNNLFMMRKNLAAKGYVRVMATRAFLDCLSVLLFAFKLDFKKAMAVIRARADYARSKKRYPRSGVYGAFPECFGGSVVVKYYLFGCKTFEKLRSKWK